MKVSTAVSLVSSGFVYRKDNKCWLGDTWNILQAPKVSYGDCDDFSLTCLWLICDRSPWKFLWYVLILHKYRLYFSVTEDRQRHVVGYANGYWFDNYTKEPCYKNEFLQRTKHKVWFFYPSPFVLYFMLLGKLFG
jgi:hypothetical protein